MNQSPASTYLQCVRRLANVVGAERAVELFESAYDGHGRRLAKLYQNLGAP